MVANYMKFDPVKFYPSGVKIIFFAASFLGVNIFSYTANIGIFKGCGDMPYFSKSALSVN